VVSLRRKVTLSDVATRAGVSATTASYVLNGRSAEMRISEDAERRVRQAIVDLGFRPNRSARNLRTSKTSTVGVISDFVASGHFSSQMLAGASEAARQRDHLLVIGETGGDAGVEALLIEEMLERQVDGIIYVTRTGLEIQVPDKLAGTRTVLLNCLDPASPLPAFVPDEFGGGRTAAEVLLSADVTGEIHVVGEDPSPHAFAGPVRLAGIRDRLAEAGRSVAGVVPCPWAVEAAYGATHAWLATGARPDGLICLNDRVAMGVYQALAEHGLDVPGDVSVVSFDGSELATWLRPQVISVALPFLELGARAVHTLLDPGALASGVVRLAMPLMPGGSVRAGAPTPGFQPTKEPPRV
jgi:LacI family transcriptional regulator